MRSTFGVFSVLAFVGLFLMSGCSNAVQEKPPDVFYEYLRSNQVKNDPFPSTGSTASADDRIANFASQGSFAQIAGAILGAMPCGDGCRTDVPTNVQRAAEQVGSPRADPLFVRGGIVKHANGSLEVIEFYLAGEPRVLIDANGDSYEDLDEFTDSNDLLTEDDWLLVARNVTSTATKNQPVTTVRGQNAAQWPLWLAGAGGLVLVLVVVLLLIRRGRTNRRSTPANQPPWVSG